MEVGFWSHCTRTSHYVHVSWLVFISHSCWGHCNVGFVILKRNALKRWLPSWLFVSSCPDPHPESRQGWRVVEVHSQYNICVQARNKPDTAWWPDPLDTLQGHCLQMPQNQVHEEILAAGPRWRLTRPEWHCGRQKQPGDTMEGHVGETTEEVPATGEERKVQESLEKPGDWKSERLYVLLCVGLGADGGIRDAGKTLTWHLCALGVGRGKDGLITFYETCQVCTSDYRNTTNIRITSLEKEGHARAYCRKSCYVRYWFPTSILIFLLSLSLRVCQRSDQLALISLVAPSSIVQAQKEQLVV